VRNGSAPHAPAPAASRACAALNALLAHSAFCNWLSRAACTPGHPCALPSPILRRLSSPATPGSAVLRLAPGRSGEAAAALWAARKSVRTVGRPVGMLGRAPPPAVAPKDRLNFLIRYETAEASAVEYLPWTMMRFVRQGYRAASAGKARPLSCPEAPI